ncbi:hypothetical protein V1522DRAFT_425233, partial [Lipomyces starkeyi]
QELLSIQQELLQEKGADINAEDPSGLTAMHSAVYRNDKEMVELLVERGADINAKDSDAIPGDSTCLLAGLFTQYREGTRRIGNHWI